MGVDADGHGGRDRRRHPHQPRRRGRRHAHPPRRRGPAGAAASRGTAFRRQLGDDTRVVVDCNGYPPRQGRRAASRWRAFLAEKARTTGAPQEMGPLNPYERRIVHMAIAEDPTVTSESIGDAFHEDGHHRAEVEARGLALNEPAGSASRGGVFNARTSCGRNRGDVFAPDDTIVAVATPPAAARIGVVRLSGPSAHRITDQFVARRGAAAPRRAVAGAASLEPSGGETPRRRRGRSASPRRTPIPARTSPKSARTATRCCSKASSAPRCGPARGSPSRASSRCGRSSTASAICCRPKRWPT